MDLAQAKLFVDDLEGKCVGGWTIKGFYGNGKSAVVLKASKEGTDGALKVFHPELIERYGKHVQLERILREKSLVGAEHPNLVRILDGGECNETGYLFVVMEPLAARNLHDALKDVPLAAVPKLIAQVASAAHFLEDRGLAHRDIKPENIAVSDDYSTATLLDLGVLRPIGVSDLTDVDQRPFIGTLRYSAPEFLLRQEEDTTEGWRAVTFYQLGAVLHDLLMRKVLFEEYSEPFSMLVKAVTEIMPKAFGDDSRCVALARNCLIKNPRTRLELVKWEDFAALGSAEPTSKITDIRERIRQRQVYFRAAQEAPQISAAEQARALRRLLLDVCNRLESRIAGIINDQACFPLREVRSERDEPARKCVTRIDFECDEDKGLPFRLCILIEVFLLDENNGTAVFRAHSAALLAKGDAATNDFAQAEPFFAGELSALLDSPKLVEQVMTALDAAYVVLEKGLEPVIGKPLQLRLQGDNK